MNATKPTNKDLRQADWELDFYSRPILEADGKKRWELLITSSEGLSNEGTFKWEKRCPAGQVNSLWLTEAFKTAIEDANIEGWDTPLRLRCWRTSMRSMITRAAEKYGIEVIASRRTYTLLDWIGEREREIYPREEGYIAGPLAPPTPVRITNQAIPLPEAVRGDAWTIASIPIGMLKDAKEWPMKFSGLLPIQATNDESIPIPGLRLFSKTRALALAGWLGGLEPFKLVVEGHQLLLEAGQEDRWLVTDLKADLAKATQESLINSRDNAQGLHFISVQSTPKEELFTGFWMLKDLPI